MKKLNFIIISVFLVTLLFANCKTQVSSEPTSEKIVNPLDGQGITSIDYLNINEKNYTKTTEIVVIPEGKSVTINVTDDSSWNTYYNGENQLYKGVFVNGRNIQLSAFTIGAYEVTQILYEDIMGYNPSYYSSNPPSGEEQTLRPVEKVSWYDAVMFCNELTKITMSEEDCVYTISDIKWNDKSIREATVEMDITKKGYRLPTEAEWEFAARGGNPFIIEWTYAYSGMQTNKQPEDFLDNSLENSLENYAWYGKEDGTHEVGKKLPNRLGLYDMSGNVREWCYDYYNDDVTINDEQNKIEGIIVNPYVFKFDYKRVMRGNNQGLSSYFCVSNRMSNTPSDRGLNLGFRIARTL